MRKLAHENISDEERVGTPLSPPPPTLVTQLITIVCDTLISKGRLEGNWNNFYQDALFDMRRDDIVGVDNGMVWVDDGA